MECSYFRTARGDTWEQKAKNACSSCQKCNGNFPLDPDAAKSLKSKSEKHKSLINRAFRLRQERQSGYPRKTSRIAAIEFEVLLKIDAWFAAFEKQERVNELGKINNVINELGKLILMRR